MASLMCFLLTGRPLAPRPFQFVSCCVLTFCLSGFIVSFRFLFVFLRYVCFFFFSFFPLIKSRFFHFSSHFVFGSGLIRKGKKGKEKGGSHSKRLLVGSFCPVCFFFFLVFPGFRGVHFSLVSSVFIVEKLSILPLNPVQRIMKDEEQKEKEEREKRKGIQIKPTLSRVLVLGLLESE